MKDKRGHMTRNKKDKGSHIKPFAKPIARGAGSSLPKPLYDYISVLISENRSATYISHDLDRNWKALSAKLKLTAGDMPSERNIQRMVTQQRLKDKSGVWELGNPDFPPRDILSVLQYVIRRTQGNRSSITKVEARHIARIALAAPSLLLPGMTWLLWTLAHMYASHEIKRLPTKALDVYMAFQPWAGQTQWQRYTAAVGDGKGPVPPVPLWSILVGGKYQTYQEFLEADVAIALERSIEPYITRAAQLKAQGYPDKERANMLDNEFPAVDRCLRCLKPIAKPEPATDGLKGKESLCPECQESSELKREIDWKQKS